MQYPRFRYPASMDGRYRANSRAAGLGRVPKYAQPAPTTGIAAQEQSTDMERLFQGNDWYRDFGSVDVSF